MDRRKPVLLGLFSEKVMVKTFAIIVLTGLPLLLCGCSASSQAGKVPGTQDPAIATPRSYLAQDGFAVLYFRAIQNDFGGVSVVGEVRNIGSAPRGVELQAALRDTNGRVVAVGHFCPASYQNINPGETWPFSYSFGRQEGIVHAEMRIVGSFRTLDILDVASANHQPY
ncbi:MAG TPA: FxLYD domain-containing protein [Sedimentisphaerales bacterium]|nr:FxLYD domain-containing protein [Sedimentisphaerales bacterium]